VYVLGDEQAEKTSSSTASSRAHSNVAPSLSDEKVKVAVELSTGFGGNVRRFVSGGAVIVHVQLAGVGSTPPTAFLARTRNVCSPGRRLVSWYGDSHDP
jgi:hypothetical protein